jgi:hypothetical protein
MIMIGAGNDRQFGILCECIGRGDVGIDERFLTNSKRVGNREGLLGIIQGEIEKRRTEEWLDIFEGKGMPYAAIKYPSRSRSPLLLFLVPSQIPWVGFRYYFWLLRCEDWLYVTRLTVVMSKQH